MTEPIPIRNDGPLVSDIAGQLRRYADQVERGEFDATTVVLAAFGPGVTDMNCYCWGEHPGDAHILASLELAKMEFAKRLLGGDQ